jgi:hypothetical protein
MGKEDGAMILLLVGAGVGTAFLLFRMYCKWKIEKAGQ